MDIYPAIDLRGGRVVRLREGDPARQTVFDDDPLRVGRRWHEAGARWLHVVNLDGAFEAGGEAAWRLLPRLAQIGPRVQFGGGLRSPADVERALGAGAARVVLGTLAVEQPEAAQEAAARFGPERVAVGIDARDGRVRTRGWQADGGLSAEALGAQMRALGIALAVHTDIGRDGVLAGVNAEASKRLARETGLRVIASGGVSALEDVRRLRQFPEIEGVIVGRALYEGRVELGEALRIAQGEGTADERR